MHYTEGFVIPVATADRAKFINHATRMDTIFLEFGATRIVECWGDDVAEGKVTDFARAVQATPDETVCFSWIEWPDKATRDAAMEKMMSDPRFTAEPMPFDGKRMIFGGFVPVVDLHAKGS
ncbi:MAG: signal recognition particle [Sphingomonadales bacterium]|nr:signal recognition particle [Sphingomonadales bacterium]